MNERINEKLGAWLLNDGNTREELAKLIGISRPALNSRLAGTAKWNWDEVLIVAQITNSTLNELAGISAA